MRRNALVIGANEEALFSIETAHRAGLFVTALDGNPNAKGLSAADTAYHVDINDLEAVYAITDPLQPCVVVPGPIGHCLTTVGAVNDRYGLPGVSGAAAALCTDKLEFHRAMAENGLRKAQQVFLPKGKAVSEEDLLPLTEYPVVVKPRYGSGSRGVEICGCLQELLCLLRYEISKPAPAPAAQSEDGQDAGLYRENSQEEALTGVMPEDYVVETCVPGPEYGVDGAYVDGQFRMVLLRRKKNTPPPYRQCVGYYAVLPDEDPIFYENCCQMMQKMGETLGFENCVVHADIIRRRLSEEYLTGEPFVIEASARPSGHNLSNLFTPLASGVTLVEDFLRLSLGESADGLFRPTSVKKLLIRYFDLTPGRVVKVPDQEELQQRFPILAYECRIRKGDVLSPVTDGASVMGRGYYILEGESDTQLDLLDESLRAEFQMQVESLQ